MARWSPALAALLLAATSVPACAQTIRGRALDDSRHTPVSGALVRLLDKGGDSRAETLADSMGVFVIRPPAPGNYYLTATRVGYQFARSPLLALDTVGVASVDLTMLPQAIGLEGITVEVDVTSLAEDQLKLAGINAKDLGNNFIDTKAIEAMPIKRDVGAILELRGIAGMQVSRPENATSTVDDSSDPDFGMCFTLVRGHTIQGAQNCALGVVDGRPVTNLMLVDLDPETIAAVAVLKPIDAQILFGEKGKAGAVMFWTKHGGGR